MKIVTIGENNITEDQILTHEPRKDNIGLQMMLAEMRGPEFPIALGVIRRVEAPAYEDHRAPL